MTKFHPSLDCMRRSVAYALKCMISDIFRVNSICINNHVPTFRTCLLASVSYHAWPFLLAFQEQFWYSPQMIVISNQSPLRDWYPIEYLLYMPRMECLLMMRLMLYRHHHHHETFVEVPICEPHERPFRLPSGHHLRLTPTPFAVRSLWSSTWHHLSPWNDPRQSPWHHDEIVDVQVVDALAVVEESWTWWLQVFGRQHNTERCRPTKGTKRVGRRRYTSSYFWSSCQWQMRSVTWLALQAVDRIYGKKSFSSWQVKLSCVLATSCGIWFQHMPSLQCNHAAVIRDESTGIVLVR